MRVQVTAIREALTGSYWFIPSLMAVAAGALALGLVALDRTLGEAWIGRTSWFLVNRAEGARVFLGALAGSMVTVAGVVFSTMLAAVTYATGQFGPRLLTNFMRDRANQVILGTFTATFLYCILVLRTIRSATEAETAFVPHVALFVGMLLALASLGVLIFFVHHAPRSVHASFVAARIGEELRAGLAHLFPERIGHAAGDVAGDPRIEPDDPPADAVPIANVASGYVQAIEAEAVMAIACRYDLVVYAPIGPGVFVVEGTPVFAVAPAARVTDAVCRALQATVVVGSERTPRQDALFLADELAEVTARALSPGVNDPFTAITCLDWLLAAATFLAGRDDPSRCRYDAGGHLRIVARSVTFDRFVAHAFEAVRPYVARDRNAALHLLRGLARLATETPRASDRARLHAVGTVLHAEATALLPFDRERLDEAYAVLGAVGEAPTLADRLALLRRVA